MLMPPTTIPPTIPSTPTTLQESQPGVKVLLTKCTTYPSPLSITNQVMNSFNLRTIQRPQLPHRLPTNANIDAIYPNPAISHITVDFQLVSGEALQIQVLDAKGRIIHQIAHHQYYEPGAHQLRIKRQSNWAAGVYYCRIMGEGFSVSGAFTVQ